jgi:hypothetical protein
VFIIQQIDGNVIGPVILGDSVGISPVWIIISILVFGGFFGFLGMLLGVPLFATIYTIVKEIVEGQLEKKELPIETDLYYPHHRAKKLHLPENANFKFFKKVFKKISNKKIRSSDNPPENKRESNNTEETK